MQCVKCKKEALFQLQEWYCASCFCLVIEKRVKKYIRTNALFAKNDLLYVAGELGAHVLREVIQGLPVEMFVLEEAEAVKKWSASCNAKLILPWTMDKELAGFLKDIFHGMIIHEPHARIIKIFLPITEPELKKYAELKHLPCPEENKGSIIDILNQLEAKYPSSKYSLAKSMETLRSMMQNANIKKIDATEAQHEHSPEHHAGSS